MSKNDFKKKVSQKVNILLIYYKKYFIFFKNRCIIKHKNYLFKIKIIIILFELELP